MSIDLLDVIAGREPHVYESAYSQFIGRQLDLLASVAARLQRSDRALFQGFEDALEAAWPIDVSRVIGAPVVTHRLRTSARRSPAAFAGDFIEYLRIERAVRGADRVDDDAWTALGDTVVRPDGSHDTPVAVDGLRAVDAASPQALTMNAVSALSDHSPRGRPSPASLQQVETLLARAVDRLAEVSPSMSELVRTCVLGLVAVTDPELNYSSSTHGLYVGRVTIGVGDWGTVADAAVVDSLVHEAIHCVLLMLDATDPLLTDDLAADELMPVTSPWTGKQLPVATYIHAVIVWFGLTLLWSNATKFSTFPAAVNDTMLRRAMRGFQSGDVLSGLDAEARRLIADHALTSLQRMQAEALAVGR